MIRAALGAESTGRGTAWGGGGIAAFAAETARSGVPPRLRPFRFEVCTTPILLSDPPREAGTFRLVPFRFATGAIGDGARSPRCR